MLVYVELPTTADTLDMKRLTAVYNVYALLIGMTSYRFVDGRLHQTRMMRSYGLLVNIILLAVLPFFLWVDATLISSVELLPRFIVMSPFVLHSATYAVTVSILISRCKEERMLKGLYQLNSQLNRKLQRSGKCTSSKLRRVLLLKTCVVAVTSVGHFVSTLIFARIRSYNFIQLLADLTINTAFNIMIGGVYLHFLYFWNITRGYEFINLRIEDLLPAIEPLTRKQIREIHHLWALHAHLERISMRLKRSCGLQLLAMRLDYFLHCIILCFVVIAVPQRVSPPNAATYFLSFICCVRSLEIFIIDYLLETMSTYHSKPMDAVIEGSMSKEVSKSRV